MRFAQIFVVGALALDQIGNGVEPKAVDAHVEPEAHDLQHRFHDLRIVEVQIRLMAEEAMPVVGLGDRLSQVQFEVSVSVKMMRVSRYF